VKGSQAHIVEGVEKGGLLGRGHHASFYRRTN